MFNYIIPLIALVIPVLGSPQAGKTRIIYGDETTIEARPYVVSVQAFSEHICGGSIISPTWIVTAAHCIKTWWLILGPILGLQVYSIRAGSTYRNHGGEVIHAESVLVHEKYNIFTFDYDIALIELEQPITIQVAQPIGLAHARGGPPPEGSIGTVSGWGALYENGPLPSKLQTIDVPVVNQEDCKAAYQWLLSYITDRMFCAGQWSGTKAVCGGDSGGPLVIDGVLTGVVSRGPQCVQPIDPAIYTSVPSVREWIRDNTDI